MFELARDAASVSGSLDVHALPRLAGCLREQRGRLAFELSGHRDALGRPAATLTLSGSLVLTCDLCGGAVAHELDEQRTFRFVRSERELAAQPLDPADEVDTLLGPRIEVAELVEDEAILSLPISPRHAACQVGIEAAVASAGEEPDTGDRQRPFADLAAALRARKH